MAALGAGQPDFPVGYHTTAHARRSLMLTSLQYFIRPAFQIEIETPSRSASTLNSVILALVEPLHPWLKLTNRRRLIVGTGWVMRYRFPHPFPLSRHVMPIYFLVLSICTYMHRLSISSPTILSYNEECTLCHLGPVHTRYLMCAHPAYTRLQWYI